MSLKKLYVRERQKRQKRKRERLRTPRRGSGPLVN